MITKSHEADPENRILTKSISKPYGSATAMPLAWELNAEPNFEYEGHKSKLNRT